MRAWKRLARGADKGKVVARRVVDGAVKGEPKAIATVMTIQSGQTGRGGGRAKDA